VAKRQKLAKRLKIVDAFRRSGVDPTWIVALQAVGGAAGNTICVHNVVAASAVVGLTGVLGWMLRSPAAPDPLPESVPAAVDSQPPELPPLRTERIEVRRRDTVSAALAFPESLSRGNPWTVLAAAATMSVCYLTPRRVRAIVPAELIALILGSVVVALVGLDLPRLARPESLLPSFAWPPLTELRWGDIWIASLVLALISSLESLLTSMAADSATQRFHDSNKELMGQGIGNLFAGLVGVIPGAGATARTMVNIRAGGVSPLSGLIHSALLLVALLAAGRLIGFVPSAVLAGILLYIGIGIVDWEYIRRFKWAPRSSVVIMLVVWVLAVFVSVVAAVAVGVIMASLVLVKRMTDLQLASVELSSDKHTAPGLDETERAAFAPCAKDVLLIHLGGPMTFGAANGLTKRLAPIANYRGVILDFTDVPHVDDSAAMALESIIARAAEADAIVILTGLRRVVIRSFIRYGMLGAVKRCVRFRRRLDALHYACEQFKEQTEE